MPNTTRPNADRVAPRGTWWRSRLPTLLMIVAACAILSAVLVSRLEKRVPWEANGGMIGWTQQVMIAKLGPSMRTIEAELFDPNGFEIRASPGGPYRTLIFERFEGRFVAWLHDQNGRYVCFRSTWIEKGTYY